MIFVSNVIMIRKMDRLLKLKLLNHQDYPIKSSTIGKT